MSLTIPLPNVFRGTEKIEAIIGNYSQATIDNADSIIGTDLHANLFEDDEVDDDDIDFQELDEMVSLSLSLTLSQLLPMTMSCWKEMMNISVIKSHYHSIGS